MNILVVVPDYPKPGAPNGGIFNEKSVAALQELCDAVGVLAPRPYAPPLISSLVPRWKIFASTPAYEVRNGVAIYRPAYPQIPRMASALWKESVAFVFCQPVARKMHQLEPFGAILSFDLASAGGLAWRIGRDLGIPAAGWATGGDVRFPLKSSYGQKVARTIERLDMVFYQSHELLEKAADLTGKKPAEMSRDRHMILPRGIPAPPSFPKNQIRQRVRAELGITDDEILVLNIGRISRDKGIFELIDAAASAASRNKRIACVIIGASPAFDETIGVRKLLDKIPPEQKRVRLLPACAHDRVWEYLCAADIFAFASHHEGMPNSLLEAMVMGVPCVAFAIPAVLEIDAGAQAIALVPPLDSLLFADAILRLSRDSDERLRLAEKGKQRVLGHFMVRNSMAEAVRRLGISRNSKLSFDKRAAV